MIALLLFLAILIFGGALVAFVSLRRIVRILGATRATRAPGASHVGLQSVQGHAQATEDATVEHPVNGERCLWYSVTVEGRSRGLRGKWGEIAVVGRAVPFETTMRGANESVHIDLTADADVFLSRRRRGRVNLKKEDPKRSSVLRACGVDPQTADAYSRLRVAHEWIAPGDELFAVGLRSDRAGPPAPAAFRQSPSVVASIGRPLILSDRGRTGLLVRLALHTTVGLAMFAAGAGFVVALVTHRS